MEKIKIQPVLVGGDINCYSVARAYHEAYGVKSIAFGKMLLGATKDSNIIDFRIDPNMGNKDEFIKVLLKTADELAEPNKKLIIHGCTDAKRLYSSATDLSFAPRILPSTSFKS